MKPLRILIGLLFLIQISCSADSDLLFINVGEQLQDQLDDATDDTLDDIENDSEENSSDTETETETEMETDSETEANSETETEIPENTDSTEEGSEESSSDTETEEGAGEENQNSEGNEQTSEESTNQEEESVQTDESSNAEEQTEEPVEEENLFNDVIVGKWAIKTMRFPEDDPNAQTLAITQGIIESLYEQGCPLIDLEYNADFSSTVRTKANYIESLQSQVGVSVPCPSQYDAIPQTYFFGFDNILSVNLFGHERVMEVTVVGDNLLEFGGEATTIVVGQGSVFNPDDFTNATAVFERVIE